MRLTTIEVAKVSRVSGVSQECDTVLLDTIPETVTTWIGWRRHRGEKWKAVAAADTYDRCWELLAELRAADSIGGDNVILPKGDNPNERRRR
jgi:hypothetical protein